MLYTFIDIETTGLMKFDANAVLIPDILEVGYLIVDVNSFKVLKYGTMYFYQDHFDIENEAQRFHGLTRTFLKDYEDQFDQNLCALAALISSATIVGKNSEKFDIPFIKYFIKKYRNDLFDMDALTTRLQMKAYDDKSWVHYSGEPGSLDLQGLYAPMYRVKNLMNIRGVLDRFYRDDFTKDEYESWESQVQDNRKRGTLEQYVELIPDGFEMVNQYYDNLEKDRSTRAHGALYDCVMTYLVAIDLLQARRRMK